MKTFLYPYKDASASAKALASALGIKRIKREGSKFKGKPGTTVINWGSTTPHEDWCSVVLNDPIDVAIATNKLSFFQTVRPELVVPWTASTGDAEEWAFEGKTVVVRHKLTGHSGDGIEIVKGDQDNIPSIPQAPLYTLYVPKKHEYRLHIAKKNDDAPVVFDTQQKKRKVDVPDDDVDWRVRNLAGGFIYAREELTTPSCVTDVALKVFEATGLDFGAVDIIYQEKHDRAYALEVNTAPGLTGTTLENYVKMFKEMIE